MSIQVNVINGAGLYGTWWHVRHKHSRAACCQSTHASVSPRLEWCCIWNCVRLGVCNWFTKPAVIRVHRLSLKSSFCFIINVSAVYLILFICVSCTRANLVSSSFLQQSSDLNDGMMPKQAIQPSQLDSHILTFLLLSWAQFKLGRRRRRNRQKHNSLRWNHQNCYSQWGPVTRC